MHGNAPSTRVDRRQWTGLALPTQHAGSVVGQRPGRVGEDAIGTVGSQGVGSVGGGVVRDDPELLPIGGEEEVVSASVGGGGAGGGAGEGGAGMAEGEEGGEAAVEGDAQEEGEVGGRRRWVGGVDIVGRVRVGGRGLVLPDLEAAGLDDGQVLIILEHDEDMVWWDGCRCVQNLNEAGAGGGGFEHKMCRK